jgi:acyl-coenzyme A thioesterase PaaI-like protein
VILSQQVPGKRLNNFFVFFFFSEISEAGGLDWTAWRGRFCARNVVYNVHRIVLTKRAQDLLVETGFKRLLSPGVDPLVNSLKNRSANGAFGKSVHESFLSANIVELRVFHNVELGSVRAIVAFLSGSEGAAGWVHGGVVAAVADMFLARTSFILYGSAVTKRVTVQYHSPVPLLAICSLVALSKSNPAVTRARATDEDGVVLFECEGTFFPRNKL